MSLERLHFDSRDPWLESRMDGIGASESAAAIGRSPFQSNHDLYLLKTGQIDAPDLSTNSRVLFGIAAEPALRDLYRAKNLGRHMVDHHPYDILYQSERPWLRATLDGEIKTIDDATGLYTTGDAKGILEIKTSECTSRAAWDKWNGRVPDNYYCQILHQMAATGWDFVDLFALLTNLDGDSELRTYHFEREECKEDIDWLIQEEEKFWTQHILPRIPPALILPAI